MVLKLTGVISWSWWATADEVQPAGLEQRVLTELDAAQSVVIGPPLIGAWSRKPG